MLELQADLESKAATIQTRDATIAQLSSNLPATPNGPASGGSITGGNLVASFQRALPSNARMMKGVFDNFASTIGLPGTPVTTRGPEDQVG